MMSIELLHGYLVSVKGTGEDGGIYPVRGDVCYIGRGSGCNIRLINEELNDRHCAIKISALRKVTVYSLNSEKPVLLNDTEVSGEGCAIESGDLIHILNYTFRWEKLEPFQETSLIVERNKNSEDLFFKRASAPPCLLNIESKENRENSNEDKTRKFTENELTSCIEKKSNYIKKNLVDDKSENSSDISDYEVPNDILQIDTDQLKNTTFHESKIQDTQTVLHTQNCFGKAYHSTPNCISGNKLNQRERFLNTLIETSAEITQSPCKMRGRRSTGVVPCVGTPSHVYRTAGREIFTLNNKTHSDRTFIEAEVDLSQSESLNNVTKPEADYEKLVVSSTVAEEVTDSLHCSDNSTSDSSNPVTPTKTISPLKNVTYENAQLNSLSVNIPDNRCRVVNASKIFDGSTSGIDDCSVNTSVKDPVQNEVDESSTTLPFTSTPHPKSVCSILSETREDLKRVDCRLKEEKSDVFTEISHMVKTNDETISAVIDTEDVSETAAAESSNIPQTPVANYENLEGVKRIFKIPCDNRASYSNVEGLQELMKTPRNIKILETIEECSLSTDKSATKEDLHQCAISDGQKVISEASVTSVSNVHKSEINEPSEKLNESLEYSETAVKECSVNENISASLEAYKEINRISTSVLETDVYESITKESSEEFSAPLEISVSASESSSVSIATTSDRKVLEQSAEMSGVLAFSIENNSSVDLKTSPCAVGMDEESSTETLVPSELLSQVTKRRGNIRPVQSSPKYFEEASESSCVPETKQCSSVQSKTTNVSRSSVALSELSMQPFQSDVQVKTKLTESATLSVLQENESSLGSELKNSFNSHIDKSLKEVNMTNQHRTVEDEEVTTFSTKNLSSLNKCEVVLVRADSPRHTRHVSRKDHHISTPTVVTSLPKIVVQEATPVSAVDDEQISAVKQTKINLNAQRKSNSTLFRKPEEVEDISVFQLKSTGEDESIYPVQGNVCYIGRASECDIRLMNDELNDRHCVIKICDFGKATIYSLDSKKPVLLNDRIVCDKGCVVEPGDLIHILNHTFRWRKADQDLVEKQSSAVENSNKEEVSLKKFSSAPCSSDTESKENVEINPDDKPTNNVEENSEHIEEKPDEDIEEEFEDCLEVLDSETTNDISTDVDGSVNMTSLGDKVQRMQSVLLNRKCFDKVNYATRNCISGNKSNQRTDLSNTFAENENSIDITQSTSKFRRGRSTGVVPCVGTPSDIYRTVTRGIFTLTNKTRFERTSMEVEVSLGSRDSLNSVMKPTVDREKLVASSTIAEEATVSLQCSEIGDSDSADPVTPTRKTSLEPTNDEFARPSLLPGKTPDNHCRFTDASKIFESASRIDSAGNTFSKNPVHAEVDESSSTLPFTSTPHPKTGRILPSESRVGFYDTKDLEQDINELKYEEKSSNTPADLSNVIKSTDETVSMCVNSQDLSELSAEPSNIPQTSSVNYENIEELKGIFKMPCENRTNNSNVEDIQELMKTPRKAETLDTVEECSLNTRRSSIEVDLQMDSTENTQEIISKVTAAAVASTFNMDNSEINEAVEKLKENTHFDMNNSELMQKSMLISKVPTCSSEVNEIFEECSATAVNECSISMDIPVNNQVSKNISQPVTFILETTICDKITKESFEKFSAPVEGNTSATESSSVSVVTIDDHRMQEFAQSADMSGVSALPVEVSHGITSPSQISPCSVKIKEFVVSEDQSVENRIDVQPVQSSLELFKTSGDCFCTSKPNVSNLSETSIEPSVVPSKPSSEPKDIQIKVELTKSEITSVVPEIERVNKDKSKDSRSLPTVAEPIRSNLQIPEGNEGVTVPEKKYTASIDACEIVLVRTESPRRSRRVSSRNVSTLVDVRPKVIVQKAKTPVNEISDQEISAVKRPKKDYHAERKPDAIAHGKFSQKMDDITVSVNPVLQISKVGLPESAENIESIASQEKNRTTAKGRRSARLKNIENVYNNLTRSRSIPKKVDENFEISPPLKSMRTSIEKVISPLSIIIKKLNDENVNSTELKLSSQNETDVKESSNMGLTAKSKQISKKQPAKNATFNNRSSVTATGTVEETNLEKVVNDTVKRGNKRKKNTSDEEVAKKKSNKEESESLADEVSVAATATVRVTRNRGDQSNKADPDDEITTSAPVKVVPRRATRKRHEFPVTEEIQPPLLKSKHVTRGNPGKVDEPVCNTIISPEVQPKFKRTLRSNRERKDEIVKKETNSSSSVVNEKAEILKPRSMKSLRTVSEKSDTIVDNKPEQTLPRTKRTLRGSRERLDECSVSEKPDAIVDNKPEQTLPRIKRTLRGSRERLDECSKDTTEVKQKAMSTNRVSKAKPNPNKTANVTKNIKIEKKGRMTRRGTKISYDLPIDESESRCLRTKSRTNIKSTSEQEPKMTKERVTVSKTSVKVTRTNVLKTVVKKRLSTISESSDESSARKKVKISKSESKVVTRRKSIISKANEVKPVVTKPVRKKEKKVSSNTELMETAKDATVTNRRPTRVVTIESKKVEKTIPSSAPNKRGTITRSAKSTKAPKNGTPEKTSPVTRITRNRVKVTASTTRSGTVRKK